MLQYRYMRTTVQHVDEYITRRIQSLPPSWEQFFRQMTLVGQPIFALAAAAAISYYGEYAGSWQLIIAGIVAATATLLGSAFKFVLRRPRPATIYARSMRIKSYSFPSGHAVASIACYGLVAYLCLASGNSFILATGIALLPFVFAIGVSRIYLGAHFPSDVIGGWILGAFGLAGAIWILHL